MVETEIYQPGEFLTHNGVFFVGSNTDNTVLVAIHPQYQEQTKLLSWWDTVKVRIKEVKTFRLREEDALEITDAQGNTYVFVRLSLPLYNNVVKKRLPAQREFDTEEDMIKAFENTVNWK